MMRPAAVTLCVCLLGVAVVGCGPGGRNEELCDPDEPGCDRVCVVGTATCNGNMATACNDDGSGFREEYCDPVQGLACDPQGGGCVGMCSESNLGTSYIGCEYYPTVTGNTTGTTFDFAVAIANTTNAAATVTIEGGALTTPQIVTVASNSVLVQALPWQTELKLCADPYTDGCFGTVQTAALATKGAYHLRSTVPVTVYQFSPLQYEKQGSYSYTNDASLLLPTNVWRGRYFAASWEPMASYGYPSQLAVTAMKDNTTVTLQPKAATGAGQGAPAFTQGVGQSVTLNAGDVIEIASITGDLTGSLVDADKPVQVISGHYCTNVPSNITACDHLEESMFPVDTLGTQYMINAPAVTTIPSGKVEVIRVIATAPGTTLTYDPPQPGAPTTIAQAGDFIELPGNANSFLITASNKVLVAQYMEGQEAGGGTGDPAMALAVPVEQFRTQYLFHAPINYESNYVDVTAPIGATVTLDGAPLMFTPIGTTGFGLARVNGLSAGAAGDGNHMIQGNQAFGITVYGYGQYTSYWYPGGLDLNTIIQ